MAAPLAILWTLLPRPPHAQSTRSVTRPQFGTATFTVIATFTVHRGVPTSHRPKPVWTGRNRELRSCPGVKDPKAPTVDWQSCLLTWPSWGSQSSYAGSARSSSRKRAVYGHNPHRILIACALRSGGSDVLLAHRKLFQASDTFIAFRHQQPDHDRGSGAPEVLSRAAHDLDDLSTTGA